MKYIVFPKNKIITHCESGIAKSENIYHVKRTMPMTELMILTSGELHIKHLEEYVLHENDVFLLPQNVLHYGTQPSTFVIHWLHIILPPDFSIIEDDLPEDISLTHIVLPMNINVKNLTNILNLCYQIEQYTVTAATQDVRNSLIKAILCEIALQSTDYCDGKFVSHKRLNSIINYINSNITQPITIDSLAERFEYNQKYIFNLFKSHLNISPLQYIIQQKMNTAKNLLLSTDNTVEAIALSLSYDNPQYFMRLFKKTFGYTPSQYRNMYSHSLELYLNEDNNV